MLPKVRKIIQHTRQKEELSLSYFNTCTYVSNIHVYFKEFMTDLSDAVIFK